MKKKETAPTHGTSEHEGKAWGHGQFANMPSESIMKPYPKPGYSTDGHLDDTISRLDDDSSNAKSRKKKNPW